MERIEGISIGLDLETLQLERGLTGLKDRFKTVNSELNTTLSAFDKGEKSIEKYEATLNGLNKKLELQKRIVSESRAQYEKMVKEHGEGSKQADAAARAYNNQATKLNNLQRSVQRTESSLSDLQDEQRQAMSGWTKLGEEAERAGNRMSGIGDRLSGLGQSLSLSITAPLLGGFAAVTKGTEELRGDLARLDSNAYSSGFNTEVMREELEKINAIVPDVNANVEGLSNLMATPFSEKGLSQAVDLLGGAAIKFSETLKFEGLADGLQETLATGAAIGPFAELLERSGVNLDTFNSGLSEAIKNGTEENYILKTLADTGLSGVNEEFRNNNKELIQSREASIRFQQSMADLGTTLTPIATKVTEGITGIVDKFNALDEDGKKTTLVFAGIAAAIGPVITFGAMFTTFLGNMISLLAPVTASIAKAGGLLKWLRLGFMALTGPVGITIGILTLLATGFVTLYKKSDTFKGGVSSLLDKLKELGQKALSFVQPAIESVKKFFSDQLNTIKRFWQDNSSVILQALSNIGGMVSKIFSGISSVIQFVMPFVLSIIKSVWGNIKGVISGALNVIMGLVKVFAGLFTGDFSKMWEGLKQIFRGAVQFIWNFVQLNMFGKLLSLGKVFASGFKNMLASLWNGLKSLFSSSVKSVKDFVVNGFNGMKNSAVKILTGMKDSAVNIWTNLKGGVSNLVTGTVNGIRTGWTTAKNKTVEMFNSIKTKVSETFTDVVNGAKALPGKIGEGIKSMAGKVTSGINSLKNKMVGTLGEGVNGAIGGVNWVLDKIGVDTKIKKWPIPEYAKGTDGHPGGLAVLGDGGMKELFVTPSGYMGMSPDKDTLMNLPKGTQVFSGPQTKQLMDNGLIPKYKNGVGNWFKEKGQAALNTAGKAKDAVVDTAKAGASKAKDLALDVWSYASNPGELMKKVFAKFIPKLPDIGGAFGDIVGGSVKKVKDNFVTYIKKKMKDLNPFEGGSSTTGPAGKGAARWRSTIIAAAARMNEQISEFDIQGIIAQIQRESGGNQNIVQSPLVRDINTRMGNPARGLLQYTPQTFRAYAMKGHGNIYSGYDQLLAFFNNTTWRRDNPRGTRGWTPRGRRKYADGTNFHPGGSAFLGDGMEYEPFMLPDGQLGLSPNMPTLFKNLPTGTKVWSNVQEFFKQNGNRTDAMKLLALAGKGLNSDDKTQTNENQELVKRLAKIEEILMLIAGKSTHFTAEVDGQALIDFVEEQQAIAGSLRKVWGSK
ncbi:hypothetical protein [Priestia flexa]|uniref:hypothetical protein n=1 Tax=Priestia flexa TaxID=86664 RepID=UPI00240974A5|nr:hypothetical protein [Priestia flexa]